MSIPQPASIEPVPGATQVAVLPLIAAIDGFLRGGKNVQGLRLTMHRVMTRLSTGYLQQVCAYVGSDGVVSAGKVGRTFSVTKGVMGRAFETGEIWRTKAFQTEKDMKTALAKDMKAVSDTRDVDSVALSYLAIPLLGPISEPVMFFYADCKVLNFFADDDRIAAIAHMCAGFCRVIDTLDQSPVDELRNYPLQSGIPHRARQTAYGTIQEAFTKVPAPRFSALKSFNFEAAA